MVRLSARVVATSKRAVGRWLMSSVGRGEERGRSSLVGSTTTSTAERLHEVRQANPGRVFDAYDAVRQNTQRRILHALATNGGRVSYKELERELDVVDRTRRKHVSQLVDANLVERIEANFTIVAYADDDAEVICREALTRWFDKDA